MQLTPQPLTWELSGIPDGIPGIRATLEKMAAIVRHSRQLPLFRLLALKLVAGLPPKAYSAEARAVYDFVRKRIRYTRDIRDVETLVYPEQLLQLGHGDCDDMSMIVATLLETLGHPCRFVAVGFKPGNFSHVLTECRISGIWTPIDATMNKGAGWEPPGIQARMIQDI
jgi:transglutaminase-like putative cysteine protease